MKEIDWSKAPADATHYNQFAKTWIKHVGSGIYQFLQGDEWAMGFGCMDSRYIERPKPEAWSGEGLPPVGTVCEVLNNALHRPEWERCTILFMGKFHAVYESESCHERVADVSEDGLISFRPIRTPEQIAAEEREKEVDQMVQRIAENTTGIGIGAAMICAKALHDAGYRKVTP